MTDTPVDPRTEPPFDLGEAEMLSAFLDYHRATLSWNTLLQALDERAAS